MFCAFVSFACHGLFAECTIKQTKVTHHTKTQIMNYATKHPQQQNRATRATARTA